MRPQVLRPVTYIERRCTWTVIIHVDTDSHGLLLHEPLRELPEQRTGNPSTPIGRGNVKVLHLAVTTMPTSQVTTNVPGHSARDRSQIGYSRPQRLPRVMAAFEIRRHAGVCRTSVRIGAPALRQLWNISGRGAPDLNTARGWMHFIGPVLVVRSNGLALQVRGRDGRRGERARM